MRDQRTIRERLAEARTREEIGSIIGRRQLLSLALWCGLIALAAAVGIVWLIAEVATGSKTAWILLALPAPTFTLWYFGGFAYGFAYFFVSGQRWPGAGRWFAPVGLFKTKLW